MTKQMPFIITCVLRTKKKLYNENNIGTVSVLGEGGFNSFAHTKPHHYAAITTQNIRIIRIFALGEPCMN